MPNMFQLNIPTGDGPPTAFALGVGDVLFVLGANGTGKSSLVSHLFNQHQGNAKRISAHRQIRLCLNQRRQVLPDERVIIDQKHSGLLLFSL